MRSVNCKSFIFRDKPSDISYFTIFLKRLFGKKNSGRNIDDCSIFFNLSLKSVESNIKNMKVWNEGFSLMFQLRSNTTKVAMSEPPKKESSAKWTPVMKKLLVSVVLSESNGRFSNLSNDKTGWIRVVEKFNRGANLAYTKGMLTSQIAQMKSQFMEFEKYASQSGFGMDSNGMVTGEKNSLESYHASHPKSRQFAHGPLSLHEDLSTLFGSNYSMCYSHDISQLFSLT